MPHFTTLVTLLALFLYAEIVDRHFGGSAALRRGLRADGAATAKRVLRAQRCNRQRKRRKGFPHCMCIPIHSGM